MKSQIFFRMSKIENVDFENYGSALVEAATD